MTATNDNEVGGLSMSLRYEHACIRLGRKVIEVLGYPSNIRFLIDKEALLIAVQPCEADDYSSFQVPKNITTKWRIYSITFIHQLWEKMDWDDDKSYIIFGRWDKKNNVVLFDLEQWDIATKQSED